MTTPPATQRAHELEAAGRLFDDLENTPDIPADVLGEARDLLNGCAAASPTRRQELAHLLADYHAHYAH